MTYVISFLKETVLDGCRIAMGFLQTTELFLVVDEGALKLSTDIKGASGLRPCLKCDVVSRARDGLPGFASVCEADYRKFELSTENYVLEIMQFLENLSRGPQSRLREYQTLTGFNHNPHIWFLQEDLRRLLPWENITYDSMHCYFSNAICCQEIGNFYSACLASEHVSRQHILDLWNKGGCLVLAPQPMDLYWTCWTRSFWKPMPIIGAMLLKQLGCSVCWVILPKQLYLPMFGKQKSKVTWPLSTWWMLFCKAKVIFHVPGGYQLCKANMWNFLQLHILIAVARNIIFLFTWNVRLKKRNAI